MRSMKTSDAALCNAIPFVLRATNKVLVVCPNGAHYKKWKMTRNGSCCSRIVFIKTETIHFVC